MEWTYKVTYFLIEEDYKKEENNNKAPIKNLLLNIITFETRSDCMRE